MTEATTVAAESQATFASHQLGSAATADASSPEKGRHLPARNRLTARTSPPYPLSLSLSQQIAGLIEPSTH